MMVTFPRIQASQSTKQIHKRHQGGDATVQVLFARVQLNVRP
jgi:hypothetical protein